MNWMQVAEYLERDDRGLPLGSTEQHGYLRLTVDAILPERVAVEAAEPLGIPVFRPEYRALYIALVREILAVARARGVTLEAFDGFDPAAYQVDAPAGAAERSLDALVAHNRKSAKTHSGIWRDLAVRKRPTEVDAQLVIIAGLGAEAGVATPLTARLVELIHDVERGTRPQALATLDALRAVSAT